MMRNNHVVRCGGDLSFNAEVTSNTKNFKIPSDSANPAIPLVYTCEYQIKVPQLTYRSKA